MKEFSGVTMYQVCLLHARADRALRVVVAQQLEEFDLTMMEWLLLATVCSGPRQGMSMSEVAGALDVTLPQVTALTNSLIKSKHVKQKVSSKDRRSRKLTSTISGKRLLDKVEEGIDEAMRKWLEPIPETQMLSYIEVVELLANLPTDSERKDQTVG